MPSLRALWHILKALWHCLEGGFRALPVPHYPWIISRTQSSSRARCQCVLTSAANVWRLDMIDCNASGSVMSQAVYALNKTHQGITELRDGKCTMKPFNSKSPFVIYAGTAKGNQKFDLRWMVRNWFGMSLRLSVQSIQHGTAALRPFLLGCWGLWGKQSQAALTAQRERDVSGWQQRVYAAIDFAALIQRINRGLNSPELSIWHLSSTFRLAWAFVFCFLFFPLPNYMLSVAVLTDVTRI